MAIPGMKPSFEVRAKVRIGEKRQARSGSEYPASVDHFICDDEEFKRVVGEGKKELRIFFPFQHGADTFSTGLEWWQGSMLACYAKGDEEDGKPFALRRATMKQRGREVNLLEGFDVLSDGVVGNDRRKVHCRSRDCPTMKLGANGCKPMGRLQFYVDGIDRAGGVFQLDTKSWHSVENLEKVLRGYSDLRGVPFVLRVAFTQEGDKRFPELYLEAEAPVEVNDEKDVALADALVQLRKAVDAAGGEREALVAVLDVTMPGWREREDVIDRIKAVGVAEAARKTLERYDL